MTEEIKEILLDDLRLKDIRYCEQKEKDLSFNTEDYQAHLLLNYITNLQNENMKLISENEAIKNIKYTIDDTIYERRNEKAIEFIKENDGYAISRNYYDKKLLNILKGSDE